MMCAFTTALTTSDFLHYQKVMTLLFRCHQLDFAASLGLLTSRSPLIGKDSFTKSNVATKEDTEDLSQTKCFYDFEESEVELTKIWGLNPELSFFESQ